MCRSTGSSQPLARDGKNVNRANCRIRPVVGMIKSASPCARFDAQGESSNQQESMRMPAKTVAVVGASANRAKFGNKAVRAYRDAGWRVFPIHPTLKEVEGLPAYCDLDALPIASLDQVSFYVPPHIGVGLLDQVKKKSPHDVWLNPGSESREMLARALVLGLNVIQACSILGVGQHPGSY
jgi:predicted CoA-binding protein